ncbi:hypothetical protein C8Q76DRAFT_697480, partial [Earliella scabrosa]
VRASHTIAHLPKHSTISRYQEVAERGYGQHLVRYGKEHQIWKDALYLVTLAIIGTIEAQEYALWVIHKHPLACTVSPARCARSASSRPRPWAGHKKRRNRLVTPGNPQYTVKVSPFDTIGR